MNIQQIKMTVSAVWMLAALLVIVATKASMSANVVVAALGVLPPLALLLLWNDPTPTMSEIINNAKR